jgi:hypothetical protein
MKTTIVVLGIASLAAACNGTPAATDGEARTGAVTVHAYEEGVDASGRIAVFQNAAGIPLATRSTGSDGTATNPITAGDMVTVANVGAPIFDLITFADVEPGDELTVGELAREDGGGDIGAVPVTLSSDAPGASVTEVGLGQSYVVLEAGASTLHLTDEQIDSAGWFQVLGVARDATGAPVAFTVTRAAATAAADGVLLPEWRTDWDAVSVALTGLSAGARVEAAVDLIQGAAGRFAGWSATAADPARFEVQVPRDLGEELEVDLDVVDGGGLRVYKERGPARSEVALDAGGSLLPVVSAVEVDGSVDPVRPTVSWQIAGDPSPADFVLVRLTWGLEHRWTVLLPPGHAPAFQLPELPAELAGWGPGEPLEVAVGIVDLSTLEGYRAAVRRGVEELEDLDDAAVFRLSAWGDLGL